MVAPRISMTLQGSFSLGRASSSPKIAHISRTAQNAEAIAHCGSTQQKSSTKIPIRAPKTFLMTNWRNVDARSQFAGPLWGPEGFVRNEAIIGPPWGSESTTAAQSSWSAARPTCLYACAKSKEETLNSWPPLPFACDKAIPRRPSKF